LRTKFFTYFGAKITKNHHEIQTKKQIFIEKLLKIFIKKYIFFLGKGQGISSSALPYKRRTPKWLTMSPSVVVDLIVKFAKKGKISLKIHRKILIFKNFIQGLTPS